MNKEKLLRYYFIGAGLTNIYRFCDSNTLWRSPFMASTKHTR